jgi:hypothetical protein
MSNHSERDTVGDAPSGNPPSRNEAAMQDTSVVPGGPTGQGGVAAPDQSASAAGPYPSYHGRTVSWVAVGIMVAGFIAGGLALLVSTGGPVWWLFWVGVGITGVGLLISLATNMFEDWY